MTPTDTPLNLLFTLLTICLTALLLPFILSLVRAEGPEEQARAQKILAGCIIAGVLMAIAQPLAFWATGWDQTMQQGLPQELITAVNNLLQLLMYLGVVVVIAGIIYGGIQLTSTSHTLHNRHSHITPTSQTQNRAYLNP